MNKIEEVLIKRFEQQRVVFWYDENQELGDLYRECEIEGVEKLEVNGNEFEVKHIITKQKPDTKLLVYIAGPRPANEDNWLLDLELANQLFYTNQEALILQEIGLDYHYKELITEHLDFFRSKDRMSKLKELLGTGDEHDEIRAKMLAVIFNTENINLITYIHAHAREFSKAEDRIERDLEKFNLADYYWEKIGRYFNYQSDKPSIYDFLLEIFNTNFTLTTSSKVNKETRLLVSLWKDTINYRESFGTVSEKIASDISVEVLLDKATLDEIIQDDLFKLTDKKIIHELANLISNESISVDKVYQYTKQRENKYWYPETENLYRALENGAELISLVRQHSHKKFVSVSEGVNSYSTTLYQIDFSYRKFIYFLRLCNQNRILLPLAEKIEKVYSNDWLLTFNDNWQKVVDTTKMWPINEQNSQRNFFNNHVSRFIEKGNRLFVIISDAFRYECGVELLKRIQSENRFEASLSHLITGLPSYTQMGMASLLPNTRMEFQNGSDTIFVDGVSSAGTANRAKILGQKDGIRGTTILAEEFMKMNSTTDGRDFVKQHDLIYIYHNRIDKIGDDRTSEEKVFEAVEEEIEFLVNVLKKIANMNGNNMLITSDHGFIYQQQPLDESDFSSSSHSGEVWKENRRYVIGKNLVNDSSTVHLTSSEIGLEGDGEILIPKSINRIRVKGSGSRFIHGGATLHEIVCPLLTVSKLRQDTTRLVEIDIIKSNDRITTNILPVSFIQQELVNATTLPRTIQAAIYAEDGERLSDIFKYNFDIEEGSERQREVKHKFQLLSKASGKYKNQRVKLLLEEPLEGSSKWKEYKRFMYTLNISFSADFDNF